LGYNKNPYENLQLLLETPIELADDLYDEILRM